MKQWFHSRRRVRLFLIAATLVALPSLLHSAGVSIGMSPIRVEHLVKPGEKGTDMISVTNDGTDATRLKVTIEDWKLTREGNPTFMKVGDNPYSCAEWIRINPVDFRIGPGQTREVRYTVTVPSEAQEAGYHAAIIFETVPDVTPGEKTKRVLLKGRIVTIVYEVLGKPPVLGHATGLKAELKKQGVDFVLTLQNTGKVHYRTKGTITVKDGSDQKVFEVAVPDAPVLPESDREIKISYDKLVPKGTYSALAVVDIGMKELIGAETRFTIE